MPISSQSKGVRSLSIILGFNAGADAFTASGAAASGATTYEIDGMPGDWSVDAPGAGQQEVLDRGVIDLNDAPILTDDQPASGSFTVNFKEIDGAGSQTLMDILLERGVASGWAASKNVQSNAEVLYCDMKAVWTHPGNAADTHFMVYRRCRLTFSMATANPTTITVNWTSREVRPTIVG